LREDKRSSGKDFVVSSVSSRVKADEKRTG